MAIQIIPNQPVLFALVGEEDNNCPDCADKPFCQIVNPADATQYQIKSTNDVINGNFDGLAPWISTLGITIDLDIHNISTEGACDGNINLKAHNFVGTVYFSLNGAAFVTTGTSDISFGDLCEGCGFVIARDSEGTEASVQYCIGLGIDCGLYKTTDSLLPFTTNQLLNCLTSDFI